MVELFKGLSKLWKIVKHIVFYIANIQAPAITSAKYIKSMVFKRTKIHIDVSLHKPSQCILFCTNKNGSTSL